MSKKALGRGLQTLLPGRPAQPVDEPFEIAGVASHKPVELPVDCIVPNPFQPRSHFDERALEELAQSILVDGVIQPLVVRQAGEVYQLIAGERRWRASKLAGLTMVPVHVQEMPDERMLEVALVENIQREDLNPIEASRAFQRLSEDLALSHDEIGRRTGKDRATISNAIRLLQLPEDVQDMVRDRQISSGHARALLKLNDPDAIRSIAGEAVRRGWSVRQLEQLTTDFLNGPPSLESQFPEKPPMDPNVKAAIEELERVLGTRVRIVDRGKGKGRIEIDYFSGEELERLYSLIAGDRV